MVFVYLILLVMVICLILLCFAYLITRMREREEKNPEFHNKIQSLRKITNPIFNFSDNIFWWIICLAFLYFMIMTGSKYK